MSEDHVLSVRATIAIHGVLAVLAIGAIIAGIVASTSLLIGVGVAIIVVELAVFALLQRRGVRLAKRLGDAAALVEQGRYEEAAALVDEVGAQCRWVPNLHAVALQRRADVCFGLGELDRAEGLALAAERSGWIRRPTGALYVIYPRLCSTLAAIACLRDDEVRATRWRDAARGAVSDARRGTLVFMEALLLGRAGLHAEAAHEIQRTGAAGLVGRPYVNVLRWLYAYSLATTVDASGKLAKVLDEAVCSTREVLALKAVWPALAAFAAERARPADTQVSV